jgi:hypothetical protein
LLVCVRVTFRSRNAGAQERNAAANRDDFQVGRRRPSPGPGNPAQENLVRLHLVRLAALAILGLLWLFPASLHAGLIPINAPTPLYQAFTNKIPITAPDGSSVNSVSDGNLTVGVSPTTTALTVTPGILNPGTYPTWGSPPQTESASPRVLDSNGSLTVTLLLNKPVHTFGLEAQPDEFELLHITAQFFNGPTPIGSITRLVDGLGDPLNPGPGGGAQLFAATTTPDTFITRVVLTVDPPLFSDDPPGFAFAEVRYSPNPLIVVNGEVVIPEPGTLALVLVGGAVLASHRRFRKGVRRAGSSSV